MTIKKIDVIFLSLTFTFSPLYAIIASGSMNNPLVAETSILGHFRGLKEENQITAQPVQPDPPMFLKIRG
jgi:hypothetical protein